MPTHGRPGFGHVIMPHVVTGLITHWRNTDAPQAARMQAIASRNPPSPRVLIHPHSERSEQCTTANMSANPTAAACPSWTVATRARWPGHCAITQGLLHVATASAQAQRNTACLSGMIGCEGAHSSGGTPGRLGRANGLMQPLDASFPTVDFGTPSRAGHQGIGQIASFTSCALLFSGIHAR